MYSIKEIYYTLQGEGAQTGRAAVFLRFSGCNLWSGLEKDRLSAVCKFCDTDFVGTTGPGGGKFASAAHVAQTVLATWRGSHILKEGSAEGETFFPNCGLDYEGATQRITDAQNLPDSEKQALLNQQKMQTRLSSRETAYMRQTKNLRLDRPYVVCTGGEPLLQLDTPLIDALHGLGFEVGIETNGTQKAPQEIDWICVSPKANTKLAQTYGHELKLVFPQENISPDQFQNYDFTHFFLQPMDGPNQNANIKAAIRYCLKHPSWRLSLQTHKMIGLR